MLKIRFVVATRMTEPVFYQMSPMWKSLELLNKYTNNASRNNIVIEAVVYFTNSRGLSALYNDAIRKSVDNPALLVFIHDDVHICDFYWVHHLVDSMECFDIVGVVGNVSRVAGQLSWLFLDKNGTQDNLNNFSGGVIHGTNCSADRLLALGQPGKRVKIIDGVVIGCKSETLINNELFFDEQFDYHFYDVDFCRQAETKNLRIGTWTLPIIHESPGRFDDDWRLAADVYLEKWGE